MPEKGPCMSYTSKTWNGKTAQSNLWMGLKATCVPKKTIYKDNQKTVIMTTGLKI